MSGWEDKGPLLSGGSKKFIRKGLQEGTGREGVIKHLARPPRNPGRFYDEAVNMQDLNGTPGILPVLAIDCARPGKPRWYVMPKARLLGDALGSNATLLDVVQAVAFLADVLACLAEKQIYHRDIKPANLFWWDDGPVLADFGIASWGASVSRQAGATRSAEKLGPANFIAPEMRYRRPADRGSKADVYSLAKTLFVLALPHRGPYPPDGTHRADGEEFFMHEAGKHVFRRQPLTELGHVLEAATEFSLRHRLSMADFRDELRAWLDRNSGEQFKSLGDQARDWRRTVPWGPNYRYARDREETEKTMRSRMWMIAAELTGDEDAWEQEESRGSGEILGDYGWEPNEEDGFVPEGWIWMATKTAAGRRIILSAVFDRDEVSFVAEAQTGTSPWTLERQWGPTEWARPRMPRTSNHLNKLTSEVITWIKAEAQ